MRRGRKTKPVIGNAELSLREYLPARERILRSEIALLNNLLKETEMTLAEIRKTLAALEAPADEPSKDSLSSETADPSCSTSL